MENTYIKFKDDIVFMGVEFDKEPKNESESNNNRNRTDVAGVGDINFSQNHENKLVEIDINFADWFKTQIQKTLNVIGDVAQTVGANLNAQKVKSEISFTIGKEGGIPTLLVGKVEGAIKLIFEWDIPQKP